MSKPDGGPSFPHGTSAEELCSRCKGSGTINTFLCPDCGGKGTIASRREGSLSVRDYFAVHATDDDVAPFYNGCTKSQARYRFADAMLEARK